MGYMNHKNPWIDMLCFWEGDNLLGCLCIVVLAPIAIPFLFIVWICGGLRKYVAVSVRGDLSVPLDEFIGKLKAKKIKYVAFGNTSDVSYVICNAREKFPGLDYELSSKRHMREAKIVSEEEFWSEIDSQEA